MAVLQRLRVIRIPFGIATGLLAWISLVCLWSTHAMQNAHQRAVRAQEALTKFHDMELMLESASASVHGYIVTGDIDRLNTYHYAKVIIPQALDQAQLLVPLNRSKSAAVAELKKGLHQRLALFARMIQVRNASGAEAAMAMARGETGAARDQWERQLTEIRQEFISQWQIRSAQTQSKVTQTKALLTLATLISLGLIGWTYVLTRREAVEREVAESAKGHTEALLHSVIQHIPYLITLKETTHGRLRLANAAAENWLGKSGDDIIGSLEADLRNPKESSASSQADRLAISERRIVELEESLEVSGKAERLLHTLKIPVLDDQQQPIYVLSISEDMTQRKKAERMLEISRDAAVEAVRLRSEFIRNMSHELRTPLSIVMGMAALLHDTDLTPGQKKFVETIRRSADGLSTLTKTILDFARIEAGSLVIENREMSVMKAAEDVLSMVKDQAKAKNLTLVSHASPQVPPTVRGDATRLRQVLTQLVLNAVKFTEKGQISIRVTMVKESETQAWLRWQVTDTGIGITEDIQKHLFQPFRQGDGSWTRRYGGTGLGLAMTKRMVELMGGEIGFESAANMGSTFFFTIPFTKRHVKGPDIQSVSMPWTRAHVVIVSDNEPTRVSISQYLKECALSCDVVSNGQAAFELLRKEAQAGKKVALILVDMQLADMDAIHFVKAVKQDGLIHPTKVALMVSEKTVLDAGTSETLGFAGSLRLPCEAQEFYDRLAAWIDPREPRRRERAA